LTEHVIAQAQRYGVSPQEFAQQLTQAGNLPALVSDVRRSKALATVLERATVTDASGRPVDLSALRRRPEADEAAEADEPEAAPPAAPAGPASATSILPVGS
ncbi:MAG TPA: trigger factor, partial [Mycobacteriales bacterium]